VVLVANLTRPGITVLRSDETWLPEWSDGLGERSGARSPVAWDSWGKPVFRHLYKNFIKAGSLAWGRAVLTRRASTQAESRPGRRGTETAKFRHEWRASFFHLTKYEE